MDELLAEVNAYIQRGFKMVKMKVGRSDLSHDVERVRAVRELVGEKVRLMVDANQAWSPHQAIAFARQVQDQDIFWFEEPVQKDYLDGYCKVASTIDIPVATGEREFCLSAFREFLVRKGAAIIQPDALRIGGLTPYMKVVHMADINRSVAPHFYKEIDIHVLAAIRNGLFLEYFSWLDPLLVNPIEVSDGMAQVPQRPGLGIEFKPEAVKEFEV